MAYIPNTDDDRAAMLQAIGLSSLDELFSPIPESLQLKRDLAIPKALDQISLTKHYQGLGALNADAERYPCFLGAGIYDHYVPPTVGAITGRSEFYTSYTPYQPEVSQGVLQSIYEFQTLVAELYGMDIANASMYDAATGLAEAAIMAADLTGRRRILVPETIHPAYRQVLETYVRHIEVEIVTIPGQGGVVDLNRIGEILSERDGALLVQHPNFYGNLEPMAELAELAHSKGVMIISCNDPISLGLLKPPGDYGVDIAIGEGQSLGCTMGYGGPLLGLFTCKNEYLRRLPGRVVGATKDIEGRPAYVMTLRTREQDIRRERATSNICTNVALYALAATVYLATMGKEGMRRVAELCLQKAHYAAEQIANIPGYALSFPQARFFKEFAVDTPIPAKEVNKKLWEAGMIGGHPVAENRLLLAVTEKRSKDEIDRLVEALKQMA